jgi:hypothetical protein
MSNDDYEIRYNILQMIPAPPGLVAVYIVPGNGEEIDTRSAEYDVVAFGVYDRIADETRGGIGRRTGPLIINDSRDLVPAESCMSFYRLELNGRLYGERFHRNSRHNEQRLEVELNCLMHNVVPADDAIWSYEGTNKPLSTIIPPSECGSAYVPPIIEEVDELRSRINEAIKKTQKDKPVRVHLGPTYISNTSNRGGDFSEEATREGIRICRSAGWCADIETGDGRASLVLTIEVTRGWKPLPRNGNDRQGRKPL